MKKASLFLAKMDEIVYSESDEAIVDKLLSWLISLFAINPIIGIFAFIKICR